MTTLRHGEPLTRADLEQIPDDGHRYEIVDGTLVVTPAPSPRHQFVLGRLYVTLLEACPSCLRVAFAPLDVALDDHTVVQPDLLVARSEDFTDRDLPTTPLLAVEIISPSTRLVDTELKRARFQAAGCPSYWVIDPDALTLTAWELHDQEYVVAAQVSGDQAFFAQSPYPVTVSPAALVD